MQKAKTEISLHICASDLGLCCPLTESLDTTEGMNGEQWLDDTLSMNQYILGMFEGNFSLDSVQILYIPKIL